MIVGYPPFIPAPGDEHGEALKDRLAEIMEEAHLLYYRVMMSGPNRTADEAEVAMRHEIKLLVLLLQSFKDDLDERIARRRAA
jgi:hypothetical protein